MSILQLIFRKGNYLSTVELDAVIRETATATSKITQNPVENGADVNDHIIIEPMTFEMEGVVSDVSSSTLGQFTGILNQSNQKTKATWNDLLKLQTNREPFKLVQGLKTYPNVVITSLTESQDKDTSNALFFIASLKEFIFVGAQEVTEEQFSDSDISDKMVPSINGGLKQLKEAI